MPVIFLAHGAPILLDDPEWPGELAAWAHALPKPKAILMVSAHWESRPFSIGATRTVPLVYDFYGFPARYYEVTYPSPGAAELAERVRRLLRGGDTPFAEAPERGLDHGAYVPLVCMYPDADVPVLQVSMPSLDAKELFALGRTLAPLRDEGVLVIGSGFLTHDLRALGSPATPSWATEFDAWTGDVIARGDVDALLDYRARAPAVDRAHPTKEHFVPLVLAAGAGAGAAVEFPIGGFWRRAPAFSKRSVQFG